MKILEPYRPEIFELHSRGMSWVAMANEITARHGVVISDTTLRRYCNDIGLRSNRRPSILDSHTKLAAQLVDSGLSDGEVAYAISQAAGRFCNAKTVEQWRMTRDISDKPDYWHKAFTARWIRETPPP